MRGRGGKVSRRGKLRTKLAEGEVVIVTRRKICFQKQLVIRGSIAYDLSVAICIYIYISISQGSSSLCREMDVIRCDVTRASLSFSFSVWEMTFPSRAILEGGDVIHLHRTRYDPFFPTLPCFVACCNTIKVFITL